MFKAFTFAALTALISLSAHAAVEVNRATEADLDGIKGVGPALSRRILEARRHGEFKDWADLVTRVKGLRGQAAARLSAQGLTVNGESLPAGTQGGTAKP